MRAPDVASLHLARTESIRFLRNSQQWQAIPIFVIASSLSTDVAKEAAEHGAFLARRSTWARDLSYFLAGVGFGPIKVRQAKLRRSS